MDIPEKNNQLHVFNGGMDSDSAPEVMPPNRMRFALNIRSYSFGEKGLITNVMGNTLVTMTLPDGTNKAIGHGEDEENNQFYFVVQNSEGYHTVYMFDEIKNTVAVILQSITDSNGVDILNLQPNYRINHFDVIPSVNGPLLTFTDGFNNAVKFNRNKAVDKTATGYGTIIYKDYTNAYKKCAVYAPTCSYTTDNTRSSNFLYGKLFKFAVRFIYDDGEQSNWSDWSPVPLPPNQSFTGLNSITYDNNCIPLLMETGSPLVVKIEIAMKVGSLDFVSTNILDKAALTISDNSTYLFNFYNDGADVPTDQSKIFRQYSSLPASPYCQAFVKNAMTYTKFYEGFESIPVEIDVAVSYQDLYLPDGTTNQLNNPSILFQLITNGYDGHFLGYYYNAQWRFTIGADVKAGNNFQIFGNNGGGLNFSYSYLATAIDDSTTVANRIKNFQRNIGRGNPDAANGISNEITNADNSVTWDYTIQGIWKQSPIKWTGSVNPVSFESLLDDGLSVPLIKPGSSRKYAISYEDSDGRKSLAYTCDTAVANTGFITEVGDQKQGIHTLSISNPPPAWARYYYLLRTPDSGQWIQMLIQDIILVDPDPTQISEGNSQKYVDLVVGSLFTYQKLHPNTILAYDFTPGDRLRLIKYYDQTNNDAPIFYPYLETEVLSYSINVEETVNEVATINGTDLITIGGVANPSYVGKTIVINGYARTITGIGSGNQYQVDSPYVTSTDSYSSFLIIDQRGILRIKQPDNIVLFDLSLIEIYKPQVNDSVDGYKQFYPFGEKLEIGNYGLPNPFHRGTIQDQYATSPTDPAIISTIQGDAYARNRELPTNNDVPGTQMIIDHIIDPNFSDLYESNLTALGRVFPQDDGSGVKYFGSRMRFSNNFIQDTQINGLSDFDNEDRVDYNDPYGDIQLTKFKENRIYAFKYLKTGWIGVLQQRIESADGGGTLTTSEKLLTDMQYFSWQGGIGANPESYVTNGNYIWFASANSGVFLRIAGDGCDPISELYNFDKQARSILSAVAKFNLELVAGFDRQNKEVIWSVPAYNNYIFNSGFVPTDWNVNKTAPTGKVYYAITQQPDNSSVVLLSDGITFEITTNGILGNDFFIYSVTAIHHTPTYRKVCFTVVVPENRVIGFQYNTPYCVQGTTGNTGMQGFEVLSSIYLDDNSLTGYQKPNIAQNSAQALIQNTSVITFNATVDVAPTGGSDSDIWYNATADNLYKNFTGTWVLLTDRVTNNDYIAPIMNEVSCSLGVSMAWYQTQSNAPSVDINLFVDKNGSSILVAPYTSNGTLNVNVGDTISINQTSDSSGFPWPHDLTSATLTVTKNGTVIFTGTVTSQSASFNPFSFVVDNSVYVITSTSQSTANVHTNQLYLTNNVVLTSDGHVSVQIIDNTDGSNCKIQPLPAVDTSSSVVFNSINDANTLNAKIINSSTRSLSVHVTNSGSYNTTMPVNAGATVTFTGIAKGTTINVIVS